MGRTFTYQSEEFAVGQGCYGSCRPGECTNEELPTPVIIKIQFGNHIIDEFNYSKEELLMIWKREAKLMTMLMKEANIVQIYDHKIDEDKLISYIAMERI